jgi:hypothetical protein
LRTCTQRLDVPRPVISLAVYEEGRRAVHTAAHTAQEVVAHPILKGVLPKVALEPIGVESQIRGVLNQVFVVQGVLMFV